ncbi:MAG: homogentisate 1,2-dioxygenase [Bacteroidia bacterium]|nr:homogentisate 1,2-dioxygenase [Bacteroidia bacterium]
MPFYTSSGSFPHKRHTQFRKADGTLYSEELVSSEGFSSVYSLAYHLYPPTMVEHIGEPLDCTPQPAVIENMQHRLFKGFDVAPQKDFLESRKILMMNSDLYMGVAAPLTGTEGYFYKNTQADEMLFIHEGTGVLKTMFGELRFGYGDYLIIPRGVIYQISFDTEQNRIFFVESFSPFEFPRRYMNEVGQLMEHSPFCERDIRTPQSLQTIDEKGKFLIKIKKQNKLFPYTYRTHPFDVVGWDGYFYPYAFSAHDFEPITGRVHMPPPIHQTFQTKGFVVCTFAPRLFDYHPLSIPAPYQHSNIDSDELLYYVDGDFMSRNNIKKGNMTLHPMGIPHGPHPGAVERSIGVKSTEELAVMVDTFRPLMLTKEAMNIEDDSYFKSWLHD